MTTFPKPPIQLPELFICTSQAAAVAVRKLGYDAAVIPLASALLGHLPKSVAERCKARDVVVLSFMQAARERPGDANDTFTDDEANGGLETRRQIYRYADSVRDLTEPADGEGRSLSARLVAGEIDERFLGQALEDPACCLFFEPTHAFQQASKARADGIDGVQWLVEHFIARGKTYALSAPPGMGKTAVMHRLVGQVANGRPFADRRTKQGAVAFLIADDPLGTKQRHLSLIHYEGVLDDEGGREGAERFSDEAIYLHEEDVNLGDLFPQFAELANSLADGLALIVIDGMADYFTGDEQDNNEGKRRAKEVRALTRLPGNPVVIVICHTPKAATKDTNDVRGAGAFLGGVDGHIKAWQTVEASGRKVVEVYAGKMRLEWGGDFCFWLDGHICPENIDHSFDPPSHITTVIAHYDGSIDPTPSRNDRADTVEILTDIRNLPGLSIAERAKGLGRPKATLGKRLAELAGSGLLDQDDRQRYRLTEDGKNWLKSELDNSTGEGGEGGCS